MANSFISLTNENWKPVVGFPDYLVSDYGRIRSITPRKGANANVNGGLLRGTVKRGKKRPVCVVVAMRQDRKTHHRRIHRLVLEAFRGLCPEGMEGCHNDGDATNNHIENLRWDTHGANLDDCIRHGTKVNPPVHFGEAHHNTTLTEPDILAIRRTQVVRGTKTKLAKQYNVAQITITRIINRDVWAHIKEESLV